MGDFFSEFRVLCDKYGVRLSHAGMSKDKDTLVFLELPDGIPENQVEELMKNLQTTSELTPSVIFEVLPPGVHYAGNISCSIPNEEK